MKRYRTTSAKKSHSTKAKKRAFKLILPLKFLEADMKENNKGN